MVSKIFEYAVIHKHINQDENYTEYIKYTKEEESTKHYAFSNKEIKTLIENKSDKDKIVLI